MRRSRYIVERLSTVRPLAHSIGRVWLRVCTASRIATAERVKIRAMTDGDFIRIRVVQS
jgi:hypothetical protein